MAPLWPNRKYSAPFGAETTKATSKLGATRDVARHLAGVRRELARISAALWVLMILAALALCTWYVQLLAAR
jgi:hypothetical protein